MKRHTFWLSTRGFDSEATQLFSGGGFARRAVRNGRAGTAFGAAAAGVRRAASQLLIVAQAATSRRQRATIVRPSTSAELEPSSSSMKLRVRQPSSAAFVCRASGAGSPGGAPASEARSARLPAVIGDANMPVSGLCDSRSNLGCLAGVTKTCAPVDPAVHRDDGRTPLRNRSRAMADVVDNPSQHRFEMAIGDALAVAHYETEGGRVVLLHTEVPPELAGRGIGSKLARGVFETLRE